MLATRDGDTFRFSSAVKYFCHWQLVSNLESSKGRHCQSNNITSIMSDDLKMVQFEEVLFVYKKIFCFI